MTGTRHASARAREDAGCGSDYFTHSDGHLTGDQHWAQAARSNWIHHSGRVRFCTPNDPLNDDERSRAVIGSPSSSDPVESWVTRGSNDRSFCVSQKVRIHMTGITTSSWSLGGTAAKGGPGVGFTDNSSSDTVTVNRAGAKACSAEHNVIARASGVVATAQDESGKVDRVELQTTISGSYRVNGTVVGSNHSVTEKDDS